MENEMQFNITSFYDDETGIVTVYSEIPGHVEAIGSAKCMEGDDFDSSIGTALAVGRSLQKLGKLLEKNAFNEVHRRDEEKKRARLRLSLARARREIAKFKWECDFAELINLKLAEDSFLVENDIIPEPVRRGKKKARKKAHQIRENLPA